MKNKPRSKQVLDERIAFWSRICSPGPAGRRHRRCCRFDPDPAAAGKSGASRTAIMRIWLATPLTCAAGLYIGDDAKYSLEATGAAWRHPCGRVHGKALADTPRAILSSAEISKVSLCPECGFCARPGAMSRKSGSNISSVLSPKICARRTAVTTAGRIHGGPGCRAGLLRLKGEATMASANPCYSVPKERSAESPRIVPCRVSKIAGKISVESCSRGMSRSRQAAEPISKAGTGFVVCSRCARSGSP